MKLLVGRYEVSAHGKKKFTGKVHFRQQDFYIPPKIGHRKMRTANKLIAAKA
jgi:hypothetical protein